MPAGRLVDRQQRRLHLLADIAGEGVDVDIADAVLDLPLDRAKLDPLADDADIEGFVASRTDDGQLNRRTGRALHLLDRLVERNVVQELAVDVRDVVAGLDPGAPGRRVFGRSNDLNDAVLERNGEAKAGVIAV